MRHPVRRLIRKGGRVAALCLCLGVLAPGAADAKVERVEVTERIPFADGRSFGAVGPYEVVVGKVHYAVDPSLPANAAVVDLALAPRDGRGLVTFTGDFALLRPTDPAKAAGPLLYEVTNRGGGTLMGQLNEGSGTPPRTAEQAGNGFMMEQGFTLLWSGWNWDVAAGLPGLRITLPTARNADGTPITGRVLYEVAPDAPAEEVTWTGLRAHGYMPARPDDPSDHVLTVRDRPFGERTVIPRSDWSFATPEGSDRPERIRLKGGFAAGRIYELTFTARDPVVVGLGLVAIRDLLSFARYEGLAGGPRPDATLAFGHSQSGRVITHMLMQGFHRDEEGRPVMDGAWIHVAGGGKGSFNHRFAQTTRHYSMWEDHTYPSDVFPFTPGPSTEPLSGETAGLLDRALLAGPVPKLFFSNTSAEYWNRSAALVHTTPDGKADRAEAGAVAPFVRFYHIAGGQHYIGRQRDRGGFANCVNPLRHQTSLRALTLALRDWVREGKAPPATAVPTIADGTLVTAEAAKAAFPAIPGVRLPDGALQPARLDLGPRFRDQGIVDTVPPVWGPAYVALVPKPDADGIDAGGIVLPDIAVPLGTHTGWNTRAAAAGAVGATARWDGSFIPFARTEAERAAAGDPRPSLEARYGSKEGYLARYRDAATRAVAAGWMPAADVERAVANARTFWDRLHARDPADPGCAWMFPG